MRCSILIFTSENCHEIEINFLVTLFMSFFFYFSRLILEIRSLIIKSHSTLTFNSILNILYALNSNKTNKTLFEGKQMLLVIAPFFAITLFLHVQMINQMKISENYLKILLNLQTYIQTY